MNSCKSNNNAIIDEVNDIHEQINNMFISDTLKETQKEIETQTTQTNKVSPTRSKPIGIVKAKSVKRSPKSGLGVRRIRRQNNLNSLLELIDDDEIIYDQLLEPCTSPIAELHCDGDKMQAWNEFIDSSENEQSKLLKEIDQQNSRIDDDEESTPLFRYHNIDRNIRYFLKKRKLPIMMMTTIEKDLIEFFTADTKGVFVYNFKSSYERILIHAISQYLSLRSQSFNDNDGERNTSIENQNEDFKMPPVSLVEYMQRMM